MKAAIEVSVSTKITRALTILQTTQQFPEEQHIEK